MGKGGAKKASAKVLAAAKKQAELDKLRSTSAIIDEHYKPLAQLQLDLNTHRDTGLGSIEDVHAHEKRYGRNEIPHPKTKSTLVKVLEEQVSTRCWKSARHDDTRPRRSTLDDAQMTPHQDRPLRRWPARY